MDLCLNIKNISSFIIFRQQHVLADEIWWWASKQQTYANSWNVATLFQCLTHWVTPLLLGEASYRNQQVTAMSYTKTFFYNYYADWFIVICKQSEEKLNRSWCKSNAILPKRLQESGKDALLAKCHLSVGQNWKICILNAVSQGELNQKRNTLHSKHRFKTDYTTKYIQHLLQHIVLVIIGMPVRQITLKLMSSATACIIQNGPTSEW